jgi:hypothetical protein
VSSVLAALEIQTLTLLPYQSPGEPRSPNLSTALNVRIMLATGMTLNPSIFEFTGVPIIYLPLIDPITPIPFQTVIQTPGQTFLALQISYLPQMATVDSVFSFKPQVVHNIQAHF